MNGIPSASVIIHHTHSKSVERPAHPGRSHKVVMSQRCTQKVDQYEQCRLKSDDQARGEIAGAGVCDCSDVHACVNLCAGRPERDT